MPTTPETRLQESDSKCQICGMEAAGPALGFLHASVHSDPHFSDGASLANLPFVLFSRIAQLMDSYASAWAPVVADVVRDVERKQHATDETPHIDQRLEAAGKLLVERDAEIARKHNALDILVEQIQIEGLTHSDQCSCDFCEVYSLARKALKPAALTQKESGV